MAGWDPKTEGDPDVAAPEPPVPEGSGGGPAPPPEGPPRIEGDPETWKMAAGGPPQNPTSGGPPRSGVLGRPPHRRSPARTRLRNRRFAALRQLIRDGDYFSEEEMRAREPLLYQHYIGRFRAGGVVAEPLGGEPPNCPFFPGGALPNTTPPDFSGPPRSLSGFLLRSVEEAAVQRRLRLQQEGDSTDEEGDPWTPDEAERAMLREEFTTRMYQRFLDGEDGDFDYSQVDENPDLDNLDIVSRNAEERYFDEEEPSDAPPLY